MTATRKPIRNVPKGEYVRLTENGPVWVREDYNRELGMYAMYRADDVRHYAYRKGDVLVYVGFTY